MNRKRLPTDRKSITHRVTIGEFKVYFSVGLYEDGSPGELFIHNIEDTAGNLNDGGTVCGFCEAWAIAISMLLQSGWTIDDLEKKFGRTRFAPAGFTDQKEIKNCMSIPDYIVRWMKMKFGKETV